MSGHGTGEGKAAWAPDDPGFTANRWDWYRAWRNEAPVLDAGGAAARRVVLSRHADVSRVLSAGTATVTPHGHPDPVHLGEGAAAAMYRVRMVLNDPPQHTRLRRLATPAFSQRSVMRLEEATMRSVDSLLAGLDGRADVDIVSEFAAVVPFAVICGILGIDMASEGEELVSRAADYSLIFTVEPLPPELLQRCENACQWYIDWFSEFIGRRRAEGGSAMVDALLAAGDDGERLSTMDLIGLLHSLLSAGYQTTKSTIGGGVWALLTMRSEYERIASGQADLSLAVEEVLRYETATHFARRYLHEPMELHGQVLAPGTEVLLCLAAANRDERVFPEPDRLDVGRANAASHLAFGGGRHLCLGSRLARMETGVALRLLARRYPLAELADRAPRRRDQLVFPFVESLRVRLGPRAAGSGSGQRAAAFESSA